MSPLMGSGQTQPPPKLGTPALDLIFYFCVTVAREDEEDNSTTGDGGKKAAPQ